VKLNLGCGPDIKDGYTNVDFRSLPGVDVVSDLSKFPWQFKDESASEILMLDFLEHFPYRDTEKIIHEAWRILEKDGQLIVQVPDLEHCMRAASFRPPFLCNRCGWEFPEVDFRADFFICLKCKQPWYDCATAAVHRMYGGQDYPGNFHLTGFSKLYLREMFQRNGFEPVEDMEKEHQYINWNFKFKFKKVENLWGSQ